MGRRRRPEGNWVRVLYRRIRRAMVVRRYRLLHVHSSFYLVPPCRVCSDLRAGAYSFVNQGCDLGPRVVLGRYVMLAREVSVVGADHRWDQAGVPMMFSGRPDLPETVFDDDVWVGHRAIVLAGVRVGRGAIVGAGAVVTRDVPPYSIVGGVPARVIGRRFAVDGEIDVHDKMLRGPLVEGVFCGPKALG